MTSPFGLEQPAHVPVLFEETIAALDLQADDVALDCTFGRGGHSRGMLAKVGDGGRVLALDRDPQAVSAGHALAAEDARFAIQQTPFSGLVMALGHWGVGSVDAVLFDLGVSSPQLDQPERGFSFSHDGPLDMRMDPGTGVSAAQWLRDVSQSELARVLKELGEERFAGRIAAAIVRRRAEAPFERTTDLAGVIASAMPRREPGKHPATRSFQAIRMALNAELDELRAALSDALGCLKAGGRLVVLSFHSLEDRIVKHFLREQHRGPELPRGLPPPPDWVDPPLASVAKAVRATAAEAATNPRARSAVLRAARRRV
ncbi:MAG: 16S rRNA (cytosine(1402)-N(4))-methyltransferase RsmH [Pseudomonadota bacterium]